MRLRGPERPISCAPLARQTSRADRLKTLGLPDESACSAGSRAPPHRFDQSDKWMPIRSIGVRQSRISRNTARRILRSSAAVPKCVPYSRKTNICIPASRFFLCRFLEMAERRVSHRWLSSRHPLICGRMNLTKSRKSSSVTSTHTARSGQPSIAEGTRRLKSAARSTRCIVRMANASIRGALPG